MNSMTLPEWVTEDFLKTSLEKDKECFPSVSIKSFSAEPAVPPGNNYGSRLFRILVKYRKDSDLDTQLISLILKAPLIDRIIESLGDDSNFFYEKEVIYYKKFVTETYKLDKHYIVPKHYPSQQLCLLMEDLESSGYSMVDRHQLLDFQHCQLYIAASAKLHALSIKVSKTNPDLIELLCKELPQLKDQLLEINKRVWQKALQCMSAYLEERPSCGKYSQIINKIKDNFSNFWELTQQMEKQERPIKALVQLDPWCTNMMFKYDTCGKVTDVKLLDFQNLKFTTPVIEFITFFWLSVKPEVREKKANILYRLYCDSLNNNLENLGCSERLNLEELKAEMISFSPLVLTLLCSMLPFCISDGVVDINQCVSEDISNKNIKETAFYQLYSGESFNTYYPRIFEQAEREGVFEYLAKNI